MPETAPCDGFRNPFTVLFYLKTEFRIFFDEKLKLSRPVKNHKSLSPIPPAFHHIFLNNIYEEIKKTY
jgi:hypothetical protein